jgi:hypothetical protein
MLRLHDLKGRIARLENLARGLALEAALLKDGDGPLLHRERRLYVKGIQDALAGAETARAALAGACRRLQGRYGPVAPCVAPPPLAACRGHDCFIQAGE